MFLFIMFLKIKMILRWISSLIRKIRKELLKNKLIKFLILLTIMYFYYGLEYSKIYKTRNFYSKKPEKSDKETMQEIKVCQKLKKHKIFLINKKF